MVKHKCITCNYDTEVKSRYDRHNKSIKHMTLLNSINNTQSTQIMNTIVVNQTSLAKQNEELIKEIEKLKETNKIILETNNQNTNKIVKEARAIKKSILTILNTNFKDTPSIDYIQEDEFKIELEAEYKAKIDDPNNKLIMRIFSDYDNKKLIKSISDIILKIVKKEDKKSQSVFNIDSARGNYATKIEDCWFNDKSGLQLKKYTLEMVIKYMINVLDKFRLKLVEIRNENIKKPTIDKSDFLMKYQSLLLEVNAFLSNSNTHKKIILHMCPELRMDQNLLESIEKDL